MICLAEMNRNYLSILKESLNKKLKILDELIGLNATQLKSVSGESIDDELFNQTIEEKDKCIKEIDELDKGFEIVYEHVKEELAANRGEYSEEISYLKEMIAKITEKSMEIQLSEKRNEQAVQKKISEERKKIHQSKTTNKVATDYYKNMNKMSIVDPQFVDKKN